ncbi:MAG: hypothetical protein EPN93_14515 [Spirochaetes bacterium]|nr:MAG: hypothetical protein EPN93_14515 [Spirochaetota bacterium]
MSITTIAVLEFIFAAGIAGFWVYFFLVENKNPEKSQVYLGFERSFPLPDLGYLVPVLLAAGYGLLNNHHFGYILTITAGGGLIFLGLVDIGFNAQNKGYSSNIGDTIMNLFINLACVIMGPVFIINISRYIAIN